MEDNYLDKYHDSWDSDYDALFDKVVPPIEELLNAVKHRERQRRILRTAFISGIAAMVVMAVVVFFVGQSDSGQTASPMVATLITGESDESTYDSTSLQIVDTDFATPTQTDRVLAAARPVTNRNHNAADAAYAVVVEAEAEDTILDAAGVAPNINPDMAFSASPSDSSIAAIRQDSVPDTQNLRSIHHCNCVERDTNRSQNASHHRQPEQARPRYREEKYNDSDLDISTPTYYQSITPNRIGSTPKHSYHSR